MKKKLLIISIAAIAVIALTAGTIAFRSVTGTAKNTVAASNLKVELLMLEEDPSGTQREVSDNIDILPGEEVSRIAMVKNIGKEPAWVRVSTEPFAENEYFIILDVGPDWIYDNGFWYYEKILEPGEMTSALFSGIYFSESIDNSMSGEELSLEVKADATQTRHNGTTVLEAQGWPE